ncbi:hypothetical protein CR513_22615, partial [Mucuna pruriens]
MHQEFGGSTLFNVIDLDPCVAGTQALNLKSNFLQEGEDDTYIGSHSQEDEVKEATRTHEGPMTRGRLKRIQEEVHQKLTMLKGHEEALCTPNFLALGQSPSRTQFPHKIRFSTFLSLNWLQILSLAWLQSQQGISLRFRAIGLGLFFYAKNAKNVECRLALSKDGSDTDSTELYPIRSRLRMDLDTNECNEVGLDSVLG